MEKDGFFYEYSNNNRVTQGLKIKEKLHSEVSPFQKIEVFETECFGRLLTLNDKGMFCDHDEFVYHECMAHIPYSVARKHKRVLIIGGGDGGVVREWVRHPDVEEIHLVEIDQRVIDVCKQYFPHITSGLSDKRVTVFPEDGLEFIKKRPNHYDVICVDSTDPDDFAAGLFKEDFYRLVFNSLTDEGIMVAQSETALQEEYDIGDIYNNLRKVFPIVESFTAPMLVYPSVLWSFAFCSKRYRGVDLNPAKAQEMRELIPTLKWYNDAWHCGTFALSNLHKRKTNSL